MRSQSATPTPLAPRCPLPWPHGRRRVSTGTPSPLSSTQIDEACCRPRCTCSGSRRASMPASRNWPMRSTPWPREDAKAEHRLDEARAVAEDVFVRDAGAEPSRALLLDILNRSGVAESHLVLADLLAPPSTGQEEASLAGHVATDHRSRADSRGRRKRRRTARVQRRFVGCVVGIGDAARCR